MAFPSNITKEHLLRAVEKIDNEGVPANADSKFYDVIYNGKKYPPKLLVSYANIFANGSELDRNSFSGGLDTQCFNLLKKHDFMIHEKANESDKSIYFPELERFLKQSITNDLGVKAYIRDYQGLKVKVSFGQGNPARIPWIAFLNEIDTVQNGIYPVYLYYKERKLLILAYGVSESHKSSREWEITNEKSINSYFDEMALGVPERYGTSYVFKTYDTSRSLNPEIINDDLNKIIAIYKATNRSTLKGMQEFKPNSFYEAATKCGLVINSNTSIRFISSLLTKPFVILTGLSGSGKTKLAQSFAKWICEDDSQYSLVPVGADWTTREPLLGFPNALKENEYVKPDNKVLDIIINANKYQDKPFFLILDEMNLSHVERYFADFLSVMESKEKISLHSGTTEWNNVPGQIYFPNNLFIIGTVNIDETTYMFSPKVLDRASVIEFRVSANEMKSYLQSNIVIDFDSLEAKGCLMAQSFVAIAKEKINQGDSIKELNEILLKFFLELKKTGAEFGYRSAAEILRFCSIIKKLNIKWDQNEVLDAAIMQKLLPKVHGSRRKLEPILKTLGSFCLHNENDIEELIVKTQITDEDETKIKYRISFEKIHRMAQNLMNNGFTSYAEA